MNNIKVISFVLEGTLVTPEFSQAVWHEGIPSIYASENGQGMVFPEVEAERTEHFEVETEADKISDEEQLNEKSPASENTDDAETKTSVDKKKETKKPPFLKVIK